MPERPVPTTSTGEVDALVEYLRMPGERGADLEPVDQRAHDLVARHDPPEQVQIRFLLQRAHEDAERLAPGRSARCTSSPKSSRPVAARAASSNDVLVERDERGR